MALFPNPCSSGPENWAAVDNALENYILHTDNIDHSFDYVLKANAAAGLPCHDVSPLQAQMLALFARMVGARAILEIGTLGAYSTLWMARALLPGGRLVTIEANPNHGAVARQNIAQSGLSDRIDLRVGRGGDILPMLSGPFDLIFIDADKPSNLEYIRWALRLSRPGSVIIVDNVVREGRVLHAESDDANVRGVRALLDFVAAEPQLQATAIQTVGRKGWDGFLLAWVSRPPVPPPMPK